MAADGEVVYTDAYTDIRLEEMVVTIATRIPGTDDVVALDIYPSQMNLWRTSEELPEGSRYYLSDGEGVLLYYAQDGTELPAEDVLQSYDELFAQMQQGIHDVADSSFQGPDNEKLGVYFHEMGNGWYSVITIPYASLLGETQKIQLLYWVVIVLFGLLTAVFLVRDFQSSRSTRLYNEIVRVLGNSYYALYLVDLRQGQYAMLKSSDLIRRRIDAEGPYEDFVGYWLISSSRMPMANFRRAFLCPICRSWSGSGCGTTAGISSGCSMESTGGYTSRCCMTNPFKRTGLYSALRM